MSGGRSAILTTSGGAGIVMADCLNDVGLSVPEFSHVTRARVEAAIPAFGASRNPVDMTVQISEQPEDFRSVFDAVQRSEEHTSELQSRINLVCRLLLEKKKKTQQEQESEGILQSPAYHKRKPQRSDEHESGQ